MRASSPRRSSSRTSVAAALMLFALAACATFVPQPGPGPDASADGAFVMLTRPVTAIGDTQEHESTGYPLLDNDSAVDAYVEVAQRPPEQPLFGRRIMEWALERYPDEPFIHLGDVMDLSCRSEADRMTRVFRNAGRPGAILPGNHDGLMFGIYGYSVLDAVLDREAKRWNEACRRGAAPGEGAYKTRNEAFTKRDFISLYLTEYARFESLMPGLVPPPARGEHRTSWRHPDRESFVSAIEANVLDGKAYADSFLAQRIVLPRAPGATRDVVLVALDTNQAGALATTWDTITGRSPGSVGHVRIEQIRAVSRWVLDASRRGDIVVFAGHHNWRSLGIPSRLLLRNLMSNLTHPLVYVSAHTHRGFWAEHREFDTRPLLEINVSSLSDWPIAWRRISFAYDERGNRIKAFAELMPNRGVPIASDRDLLDAWEDQTCKRAGIDADRIRQADMAVVRKQRESRGSLVGWLLARYGPSCETCDQPLYEHANAYQDAMLDVLMEVGRDVSHEADAAYRPALKACEGTSLADCLANVRADRATGYQEEVSLFRRKALLVDAASTHLDDIRTPRAKAYMTCRAVLAAKLDFDATPGTRNANRGEANRRAEQFFRVEATVGME